MLKFIRESSLDISYVAKYIGFFNNITSIIEDSVHIAFDETKPQDIREVFILFLIFME